MRAMPALLSIDAGCVDTAGYLALHGLFTAHFNGSFVTLGASLVPAMAIQNAVQRTHLGSFPPTTLMTGTTTQIMIDVADLKRDLPAQQQTAARSRLARMTVNVLSFALGCAAAALLVARVNTYCFFGFAATGARHAGVTHGGIRARRPMIVRTSLMCR
jgi:uncharacterized membrane protein YoaK (UPF0700 family)